MSHTNRENARRIVACVNACAGIPTELIEEGGFAAVPVITHREVKQQRDKLLAALKVMRERHQIDDSHHADLCEYCINANSIIKEVEATL